MLAAAEAATSSAHDRAAGHDATASARFRAHPGIREILQKSQSIFVLTPSYNGFFLTSLTF